MIWRSAPLALILLACREYVVGAQQTWPASIDELEDIMLLNTGYRARGFADAVTPCSKGVAPGRRAAAEWILTAFHDVSTGNVFTGVGGLDASIVFEAVGAENVGPAFTQTLTNFAPFLSSRSSMADLIAMGVYTAVRSCGGPIIPIRAGRRDATSGGGTGVPQPQNSLGTFRNQFTRFGFGTDAEMIQLVACGHTVGGVHGESHPLIVPPGSAPNDVVSLDSTPDVFDNKIVTEWLDWNTTDPMVVGPSIQNTRDSDKRVFIADGNVTMNALRSPETFRTVCQQVLQKMIDVVPSGVVLTAAIQPYEVKPYDVQLTLLGGGLLISFSGDIRIRTTNRPSASIANVQLVYKDRTGTSVSTPIGTFHSGEAQGFDDTFTFYGFSEILPTDTSISSFNVVIYSTSGSYEVLDNNGDGFVVDDSILYQEPQSCLDASGMLTVVAAVRNGISASPSLKVVVKNPRSSPVVVSALSTATAAMATQSAIGAYQLYSAAYTFSSSQDPQDSSFGVFAGSASDDFKKVTALHTACTPLGTTAPSPTSSLTIISTSSTTPTPTPSGFVHQGCYFDALVPRALSGPSTTDEQMTVAKCTTFCSSHQYFGLEYGQECYCGNTLDSSSYLVSSTECNMACSGDPSEMCGAASRMNLYKNSSRSTPISPQIDGYNNLGCYNEPSSVRALSDKETSSSTMTVESCASFCSGATYFGVEYGSECYCGSTLNTDSTKQPDADCSMVCSGNGSELCGGPYRLNIYQKNSTSAPTGPLVPGYTYQGCLTDNVFARTLSSKSSSTDTNTHTTCASFCTGYLYFGVEYGRECYCGDALANNPSTVPDSDCDVPCSGNASLICGAGNRLNVWKSDTITTPPSTPSITGYTYEGCYTDSVVNRTLTSGFYYDSAMTNAMCKDLCDGATLFGTEYGSECYCGEALGNSTQQVAESQCSFVCSGSDTEYCGAGERLTLWRKDP